MSKYIVRPELIDALIQAESRGNNNAVSPKGARGMAQIMPKTARNPGFGIKPLQDNSPEEQYRFAHDYVGAMLDKFGGREDLAVAAYNSGHANVEKYGGVPPFPETLSYVSKIGRLLNPIRSASASEDKPQVTADSPMQYQKKSADEFLQQYAPKKSADEFLKQYQAQPVEVPKQEPQPQDMPWGEVGKKFFTNLPADTVNVVVDSAKGAIHPLDTVQGLLNAVTGNVYKALPDVISKPMQNLLLSDQKQQDTKAAAEAIDKYFGDYFNEAGLKDKIANNPAGVLSDIAMLTGGASGLASKMNKPGLAKVLSKTSKFANPVDDVLKLTSTVANKVGAPLYQHGFGLLTQTGARNIAEAYKSGKAGNNLFLDNLKGDVPITDVLDQARNGLANIRSLAGSNYRTGMRGVYANQNPIDFTPINQALDDVMQTTGYTTPAGNFHSKVGGAERNIIGQVQGVVKQWADDPSAHTATGLDALKQRLDAIPIDYNKHRQAARVKTTVRNAVYENILHQAPEYAQTMKDYESLMSMENEISRALSLGNKASQDTAIRKLQSLSRNNVHTNYGNRLRLADQLRTIGGEDIMPAISGQAMNAWLPRGLGGQLESLGTASAAIGTMNPAFMLAMLPQSPKLVGLATYFAGKASNKIPKTNSALLNALSLKERAGIQ